MYMYVLMDVRVYGWACILMVTVYYTDCIIMYVIIIHY